MNRAWRRVEVNNEMMANSTSRAVKRTLPFKMFALVALYSVMQTPVVWAAPADQAAANTFQSTCAPCHGASAHGDTAMGKSLHVPDLHSAVIQKTPAEQLHQVIANGKGSMPPFTGRLTEAEIDSLIGYIHSLKTQK